MKPQNLIIPLFLVGTILLVACQTSTTPSTESATAATESKMQEPTPTPSTTTTQVSSEEKSADNYALDGDIPDNYTADDYRNENWRPEEGNYFFSESWTWEFYNELLPTDDPKYKGTFTIYLDPPTGTMLLAEHLDEMTDWIIVHPDGRYTTAFIDVHGKPHITKQKMTDFEEHDFYASLQAEDFEKYFTKKEGQKEFGTNKFGWETITATPYQMTFEGTNDISNLHILEMPFSVRGLYLVSKTNGDLNLPLNLNFGYLLPENYLVVSEEYEFGGKKVGFDLESVAPGEYFVNTATYTLDH